MPAIAKTAKKSTRSTTKAKSKAKPRAKSKANTRKILYPKLEVKLFTGKNGFSSQQAKDLLGWVEATENLPLNDVDTILDAHGKKVHLANDVTNRPLSNSLVATYKQEIIHKHWQFNGEPIIIGKTGLVLNGQHQMVALVLAAQEWDDKAGQLNSLWSTEPVIDKLIVLGVSEEDSVVNTMDTCKPRTLADVIYRSEYFATVPATTRKIVSRMLDYGIRMLWDRTGAALIAYSPRRTHAESLDFLTRHNRLLEATKIIYKEDGTKRRIGKFISPGAAVGLFYLMAASRTVSDRDDKKGYADVVPPSESLVDFSMWNKTVEFWSKFAGGSVKFSKLNEKFANMLSEDGLSLLERASLIIKAWNRFSTNKTVTEDSLELEYVLDEDGVKHLTNIPTVGGIDVGPQHR